MIEIFNLLLLINSGEIYVDAAKDNYFHCSAWFEIICN